MQVYWYRGEGRVLEDRLVLAAREEAEVTALVLRSRVLGHLLGHFLERLAPDDPGAHRLGLLASRPPGPDRGA